MLRTIDRPKLYCTQVGEKAIAARMGNSSSKPSEMQRHFDRSDRFDEKQVYFLKAVHSTDSTW
ncbi:hypothetical protein [Geitlerinema sp. PCC 9228]|uniref:hypothetical protein n=1 Tax=Geitlerinema sp. PCC 9228 TaxID=111611 RepID=UPI001114804B|nr:hypothetical protein [Geitlerinema sp. PCC 9228]